MLILLGACHSPNINSPSLKPLFTSLPTTQTHIDFNFDAGIADINNDGWTDIYISNDYLNNMNRLGSY
ncbi:hypothetical protein BH20BAC1_BH20BAC1_10720 [soil metagenome]